MQYCAMMKTRAYMQYWATTVTSAYINTVQLTAGTTGTRTCYQYYTSTGTSTCNTVQLQLRVNAVPCSYRYEHIQYRDNQSDGEDGDG